MEVAHVLMTRATLQYTRFPTRPVVLAETGKIDTADICGGGGGGGGRHSRHKKKTKKNVSNELKMLQYAHAQINTEAICPHHM